MYTRLFFNLTCWVTKGGDARSKAVKETLTINILKFAVQAHAGIIRDASR